jgi:hypothetical protein
MAPVWENMMGRAASGGWENYCVLSGTYTHRDFISKVILQNKTFSFKYFAGCITVLDTWILDNLEFTVSSANSSFTVLLCQNTSLNFTDQYKWYTAQSNSKINYCLSTVYLQLIKNTILHQRALTSNSASSLLHLVSWSRGHQKSGFEVLLVADHLPALCLSFCELQLA